MKNLSLVWLLFTALIKINSTVCTVDVLNPRPFLCYAVFSLSSHILYLSKHTPACCQRAAPCNKEQIPPLSRSVLQVSWLVAEEVAAHRSPRLCTRVDCVHVCMDWFIPSIVSSCLLFPFISILILSGLCCLFCVSARVFVCMWVRALAPNAPHFYFKEKCPTMDTYLSLSLSTFLSISSSPTIIPCFTSKSQFLLTDLCVRSLPHHLTLT